MRKLIIILFTLLSINLFAENKFQTISLDLTLGVVGTTELQSNCLLSYHHPLLKNTALRAEIGLMGSESLEFLDVLLGVTQRKLWKYIGISASIMGELGIPSENNTFTAGIIIEGRLILLPFKLISTNNILSFDLITRGGVFYLLEKNSGNEGKFSVGIGLTYHF